ncbi:hypothetical protein BHE74_00051803 [Ensete ventricosum]|nr:hypothetical protein BHE74_00051803 [Ensete ventricosum]
MLLRWLLPVASAGFFIARCPSPTAADSFTVGASTAGGGCSSPAATGFFTAGRMLLRQTRTKVAYALDQDLLLPFPMIIDLGVASSRL